MGKIINFLKSCVFTGKAKAVMAVGVLATAAIAATVPVQAASLSTNLPVTVTLNGSRATYKEIGLYQVDASTAGQTKTTKITTYTTGSDGTFEVKGSAIEDGYSYYFTPEFDSSAKTTDDIYFTTENGLYYRGSGRVTSFDLNYTTEDGRIDTVKSTMNLTLTKYEVNYDDGSYEDYKTSTPAEGAYKFTLYHSDMFGAANGSPIATAYNDAEGKVTFEEFEVQSDQLMNLTKGLGFKFVVEEEPATKDAMYQKEESVSNSTILITIPVTDAQSSSMMVTPCNFEYSENVYNVNWPKVEFNVYGIKKYVDEEGNALDLTDGQFNFVLYTEDENGNIDKKTVTNDEYGVVDFGTVSYSSAERYNSKRTDWIAEQKGTDSSIAYDDNGYIIGVGAFFGRTFLNQSDFETLAENTPYYIVLANKYKWNDTIYNSVADMVAAGFKEGDTYVQVQTNASASKLWNEEQTLIARTIVTTSNYAYVSMSEWVSSKTTNETAPGEGFVNPDGTIGEVTTTSSSSTTTTETSSNNDNVVEDGKVIAGDVEGSDEGIHTPALSGQSKPWTVFYSFTNVKGETKEEAEPVTLSMHAHKNLVDKTSSGRSLKANEFEFQLVLDSTTASVEATPGVIGSAKNDADGDVYFGSITFTEDMIGTWNFYVQEVVPENKATGITYDEKCNSMTVVVSKTDDGTLKVETTYTADSGDFKEVGTGSLTGFTPASN